MIYLLIDTCTINLIISIIKDDKILSKIIRQNDGNLSTYFTSYVEDLLKENSLSIDDIDIIFVANGPGSFTGVRIGLTFAKVLAWAKNIKVVPFSSLELLASTDTNKINIPILDARRGYVYAGCYDTNLSSLFKDTYISIDELNDKLKDIKNIQYISYDEFDFAVIKPNYDVLRVVDKHKDDAGVNPHTLKPNYLKRTEAEEKLG